MCIVLLGGMVNFADRIRPAVLVVATSTVNSVGRPDPSDPDNSSAAIALATPRNATTLEFPCGNHISSLLYALDVLVPEIELRQESKCDVTILPRGRL